MLKDIILSVWNNEKTVLFLCSHSASWYYICLAGIIPFCTVSKFIFRHTQQDTFSHSVFTVPSHLLLCWALAWTIWKIGYATLEAKPYWNLYLWQLATIVKIFIQLFHHHSPKLCWTGKFCTSQGMNLKCDQIMYKFPDIQRDPRFSPCPKTSQFTLSNYMSLSMKQADKFSAGKFKYWWLLTFTFPKGIAFFKAMCCKLNHL